MIKVMCNGQLDDNSQLLDRGLHYGDGLFETMAVRNGAIPLWHKHWQRFEKGCHRLKIALPDMTVLEKEIAMLAQDQEQAVIKLLFTRGQGERGYRLPEQSLPNRYLFLSSWPEYPIHYVDTGVRLRVCETPLGINPTLAGIKHLNRLEQVMARSEWQDPQIQEGIMLDQHGRVIEGTMSNIFWIRQGQIYTPDVSQCGVAGIMREMVLESAQTLNIPLHTGLWPLSAITQADEVFITNSLICLWPVRYINNEEYQIGSITKKLQQHLQSNYEN